MIATFTCSYCGKVFEAKDITAKSIADECRQHELVCMEKSNEENKKKNNYKSVENCCATCCFAVDYGHGLHCDGALAVGTVETGKILPTVNGWYICDKYQKMSVGHRIQWSAEGAEEGK